MGKTFTTEDLIDFLDDVCGVRDSWGKDIKIDPATIAGLVKKGPTVFKAPKNRYDGGAARKAIVAKLRTADALAAAAQGMLEHPVAAYSLEARHDRGKLRKAIADFEAE